MISFREFVLLETAKGQKQNRDTSVFWKDARSGAKPNVTYDVNKQETDISAKIIEDLRSQGGQHTVTPQIYSYLSKMNISIPTKVGEVVNVGRSGENTFQVSVHMLPSGILILKGGKN